MEQIYGLIDMLGMAICFLCCVIAMQGEASKNQRNLVMVYICGFLVSAGNAMEFYATSFDEAITAVKFGYIGKAFIMLFILQFVEGFSKIKIPAFFTKFCCVYNIILLGSVMTCDGHTLYYSYMEPMVLDNGRFIIIYGKGILYYAWMLLFLFCVLFYGCIVLHELYRTPKTEKTARIRLQLLLLAAIAPILLSLALMCTHFLDNFDPSTLVVVIAEVLMLIDVKIFGLFDTMQLAQESVLKDTKDGLIVVDRKRKEILYSNPVAQNLLPELENGETNKAIERIFWTKENVFEQDGRHFEICISEIKGRGGQDDIQGYLAWIFDMTFINQYTSEMIRLKEESEQANRAKTNFLAHMSHEIRTPMNAIVGYAELALRNEESKQVHDYLNSIKSASKTLLHLINEILDITKIENGKMELVNINYRFDSLMEEIRSMMGEQAKKAGLLLQMDIDEKIPKCLFGDKVKIQEILTNLTNNSIKYAEQGSITIRIFLEEKTKDHVLLHMEVEDTGIGIREQDFDKVFGKFEQFDKQRNYQIEGTGLGLSIVKSFVEMMDGNITFESEYERGTKFIIQLWQGIGKEELKEETVALSDTSINHGRVLVVDDNELNCEVAKGILNCLGIETDVILSGQNCISLLQAGKAYDIIFMDHMMPDMDGVETLHHIRKMGGIFKELPIILLTANAVSGVREEMLAEGFNDFLTKPIEIDELKRVLTRFLK